MAAAISLMALAAMQGMAHCAPPAEIKPDDGAGPAGLPLLWIDDRPVAPFPTAMIRIWPDASLAGMMLGQVNQAASAGIHPHVVETARKGLPWPELDLPREYLFLDRLVDAVLTRDLKSKILLRFDTTLVPAEWAEGHPREMAAGPQGEPLGWPSLASRDWREGLEDEVKRLCRHIKDAPYDDQIIGFVLDGMHRGQWRYATGATADHSPAGLEDWRRWLRKRYGKDQRLREAWADSEASLDTAVPPPGTVDSEVAGHLLNPAKPGARQLVDYRLYSSERIAETAEKIAGWFHSHSGGRLVCLPYGQSLELSYAEDFGSLGQFGLSRLLASKNIDALAPPVSYMGRDLLGFGPFEPGPSAAMREAGKLVFFQDDMGTHLSVPSPRRFASSMDESLALMRRGMGWALAGGFGHWFLDVEGMAVFGAPEMWDARRRASEVYARAIAGGWLEPRPEVAVVVDEDSVAFLSPGPPDLALPLMSDQREDFTRAGLSWGTYLFSRLEDIPRSVKAVFFLNAFAVDARRAKETRKFLAERGATAVWLFAPGLIQEAAFDAEGMRALTGMALNYSDAVFDHAMKFSAPGGQPILRHASALPPAEIPALGPTVYASLSEPGTQSLAVYRGDARMGALAVKEMKEGWTSIFCAHPRPGIGLIRGIAQSAGAHVWTHSTDLALHAGARIVSVHAVRQGRHEILLPNRAGAAVDLYNNLALEHTGAGRVILELDAGQHALLYIAPKNKGETPESK